MSTKTVLDDLLTALPAGTVITDPDIVAGYRQDRAGDPDAGTAMAVVRATTDAVGRFPADAVEAKGLSLTVHHRNHPELEASIAGWARSVAEASGLDSRPARMSWELHPIIFIQIDLYLIQDCVEEPLLRLVIQ